MPSRGKSAASRSPAVFTRSAAPYWNSWDYDGLGNRTSETYRTPGQDGGLVTTTDYADGGSRDLDGDGNTTDLGEFAGPHAVTGLEVTSNAPGSAGTARSSYTYDKAGRALTQTTSADYERVARFPDLGPGERDPYAVLLLDGGQVRLQIQVAWAVAKAGVRAMR